MSRAQQRQTDGVADADRFVCGYRKVRDLGAGAYGKAILVYHSATGRQYVMKAIDVTRMTTRQRKAAINEVRVLAALRHPFIIGFREAFLLHGFLCIITDFADGGDLATDIKRRIRKGRYYCEHEIISIMTQLVLALRHLHRQHILHRDLKSGNIFLSSQGRVLVGDFGIAKTLDATTAVASTVIGTPYYLSPEVYGKFPYSWASDVWALGCLLYEMCTLKVPYEAPSLHLLTLRVLTEEPPRIPDRYSLGLRDLYNDMMRKNPADRPGTFQILNRSIIRFHAADMIQHARLHREGRNVPLPFPLVGPDSYCTCGAKTVLRHRFSFPLPPPVPLSTLSDEGPTAQILSPVPTPPAKVTVPDERFRTSNIIDSKKADDAEDSLPALEVARIRAAHAARAVPAVRVGPAPKAVPAFPASRAACGHHIQAPCAAEADHVQAPCAEAEHSDNKSDPY